MSRKMLFRFVLFLLLPPCLRLSAGTAVGAGRLFYGLLVFYCCSVSSALEHFRVVYDEVNRRTAPCVAVAVEQCVAVV